MKNSKVSRLALISILGAILPFAEGCLHRGNVVPTPPPPPPNHAPTINISSNPSKVYEGSGDKSLVQAQASDPDNDPLTYTWSATGGTIEGTGAEVRWNPGAAAPGKYTITAKIDDGRGGTADASTDMTVEPRRNRPPTVTCAASPRTVIPGQQVTIAAIGTDPDNDPLVYTWNSPGGKVTGSGAQVQLDTSGLAPGRYTVNCQANDGRGGTADAKAEVEVRKLAAPTQLHLQPQPQLQSIYFPPDQPTQSNPNGGLLPSQQRILELLAADFKKYLAFNPDARLILQGHADPRGGPEYNLGLSERRAARAKAFLVEQGVPAGSIETLGFGAEQPISVDQAKQSINQNTRLTPDQKRQLTRIASSVAFAQSNRVDFTLGAAGQTSVRQFPLDSEDSLNLIVKESSTAVLEEPNCPFLVFSCPQEMRVGDESKVYILAASKYDSRIANEIKCSTDNCIPPMKEVCGKGYWESPFKVKFWKISLTPLMRPILMSESIPITTRPSVEEQDLTMDYAKWEWGLRPNKLDKNTVRFELYGGTQSPARSQVHLPGEMSQKVQTTGILSAAAEGVKDVLPGFWKTLWGKITEAMIVLLGLIVGGYLKKKWPHLFPAKSP